MKKYRVRKTFSYGKNSSNLVYHVDLFAENRNEAIKKARKNYCHWRYVDSFDCCETKYTQYEVWRLY